MRKEISQRQLKPQSWVVLLILGAALQRTPAQAAITGEATGWGEELVFPLNESAAIFTKVAAGDGHNLGLKPDGTVVAWGENMSGESTVPAGLGGVVAIAAGGYNSYALYDGSRKRAGTLGVSVLQGAATIQLAGVAGVTYEVDASESLSAPNWVKVGEIAAGADGSTQFIDPGANIHFARFYRTRAP